MLLIRMATLVPEKKISTIYHMSKNSIDIFDIFVHDTIVNWHIQYIHDADLYIVCVSLKTDIQAFGN